jgi:hypothetical protein
MNLVGGQATPEGVRRFGGEPARALMDAVM